MKRDIDVILEVTVRCPASEGNDKEKDEAESFVIDTLNNLNVDFDDDKIETDFLGEYFDVKLTAYSKGTIDYTPSTWDRDSECEYNFEVSDGDVERAFRKLGYRADARLDYEIA